MMNIGEYNTLTILRFTSVGAYLGDDEDNDVLLPNKYLVERLFEGDEITVFLYNDSEDRIVATTETPMVTLNQFAYLTVKDTTTFGAFLDWGLEKDLLVPFKEQTMKMNQYGRYMIYLYKDEQTDRLVATAKLNKHFSEDTEGLEVGQEVDLLVNNDTDLGVNVIVNQKYRGLIYFDNLFQDIQAGDKVKGYIDVIREDGKLDISLEPRGVEKIEPGADKVFQYIRENGGKIFITDKSSPDEIKEKLGMSKKLFKKALGSLYKQRIVELNKDSVDLVNTPSSDEEE